MPYQVNTGDPTEPKYNIRFRGTAMIPRINQMAPCRMKLTMAALEEILESLHRRPMRLEVKYIDQAGKEWEIKYANFRSIIQADNKSEEGGNGDQEPQNPGGLPNPGEVDDLPPLNPDEEPKDPAGGEDLDPNKSAANDLGGSENPDGDGQGKPEGTGGEVNPASDLNVNGNGGSGGPSTALSPDEQLDPADADKPPVVDGENDTPAGTSNPDEVDDDPNQGGVPEDTDPNQGGVPEDDDKDPGNADDPNVNDDKSTAGADIPNVPPNQNNNRNGNRGGRNNRR